MIKPFNHFNFVILGASTDFPKVTSLSEIEIEEDKKELDSFLDDDQDEDGASGGKYYIILFVKLLDLLKFKNLYVYVIYAAC